MYADWKGIAELSVQGSGSILISDVLYVPNLGANLLSTVPYEFARSSIYGKACGQR